MGLRLDGPDTRLIARIDRPAVLPELGARVLRLAPADGNLRDPLGPWTVIRENWSPVLSIK